MATMSKSRAILPPWLKKRNWAVNKASRAHGRELGQYGDPKYASIHYPGLGQYGYGPMIEERSDTEKILDTLYTTAKEIWPEDTAKVEQWVEEQAIKRGIERAKTTATEYAQNPLVWIGGGLLVGWFLTRKRR